MSNASVIHPIHALLDQYRFDELSAGEFERAIQFHFEALEFIDLKVVHQAGQLCSRLVDAHFLDGDEEFGDGHSEAAALAEFRQFLDQLPIGSP